MKPKYKLGDRVLYVIDDPANNGELLTTQQECIGTITGIQILVNKQGTHVVYCFNDTDQGMPECWVQEAHLLGKIAIQKPRNRSRSKKAIKDLRSMGMGAATANGMTT